MFPARERYTGNYGDINMYMEGRPRIVAIVFDMQPSANCESDSNILEHYLT
jgi:hypothetical protein